MEISKKKIVPDLRLFEALSISRDKGRKRILELVAEGAIDPKRTPTGRCLLSFEDAETLARAL